MSYNVRETVQRIMMIADNTDMTQQYLEQFELIYNDYNQNPKLKEIIDSNKIAHQEKKTAVELALKDKIDKKILDSLFMDENCDDIAETVYGFIALSYHVRGILCGKIYSTAKMENSDIGEVEKAVGKKLKKEIHLVNEIDPEILGGYKVVAGDYVLDGTIKNRMDNLKSSLLNKDIHKSSSIIKDIKEFNNRISISDADTIGYVTTVADGIANIRGIRKAMAGELLMIDKYPAMVMNLEENNVGAVLLDGEEDIYENCRVVSTGKVVEVPVGDELLGRVVDALGRPIDGKGMIHSEAYHPIEVASPSVIDRQSVCQPLETGIKVIDSMIPIGKGQRELIIGDRQTGKTAIAVDTILNQKGKNVKCIYVAIGQKNSTVAQIVEKLKQNDALCYTTIVVSSASDLPALQYIAPYSGCTIGEYWMNKGQDVLIVYDDLSKHAIAYRTLSLLLRRPPGREAYPGDVFYLHSRLLERSAKLSDKLGGGSLTALPIVETLAGDISAYIPTNVISITDGQIFLQSELFNSGVRPAVDSGLSVSRVGSAAQSKAMKKVASSLKLDLAQYQEVLDFAQFGSDLDASTRKTIKHGQHLTELLKQPQYSPMATEDQILVLLANQKGLTDEIELEQLKDYQTQLIQHIHSQYPQLIEQLKEKLTFTDELKQNLEEALVLFNKQYLEAGKNDGRANQ